MAHYLILFNFTQKGIENVRQSPDRMEAAIASFRAGGAEVKEAFLLMGEYDTAFIVEAPSDVTIAEVILALTQKGYVRSQTFRAFTIDEFRTIVSI